MDTRPGLVTDSNAALSFALRVVVTSVVAPLFSLHLHEGFVSMPL